MALLALLASTRHHVLARDKLIGLLWPETDTASARGLLSASVHTIRKALGEEVLVSEGEALRLDVSRIGIDTLDFEARYDLGDCEGAVALHSGPFLDGFSIPDSPEFDQWMDTERERLERLYYSCLDQLAGTAETGGDPASAVTWWRRRLGCTPTDARVVVRLMEALARAGDRAGALMAAAAHARLMAEELGASPDPEVFALERALRGASPAESAVPGFDGDTPNPVGGRAPELSESAKHLESANGVELPTVSPGRSPGVLRTRWLLATALVMLVTTFGLLAALRLDVRDPDVTSLLVLPFDDLGGPAGSGYFVEGMYGAVHSELARISALRVISRTSALHYKNSGKPLSAIAAEASADAVVEGQVVRSGDRVRVQVQLVGVGPERQLWTDSFDRDLRDVLALHSDVARAIAAEVEARLTPVEEQRLLSVEEVDPQAYDDWLRASTHGDRYNAEGRRECVRYGKLAAARDSSFAPTFALLAQCYSNMTFLAGAPTSAMFDSSKAAATAALELDDRQVQAMAALAFGLAHHDWDWTGAETTYRRALDINPSYGYARLGLAWLLAWFGKFDEAIMHARLAQRIDPVSVHVSAQIAMIYHLADRNDEALRSVHRAIELDTGFAFAYDRLHWIHHSLGDASNAVAAAERAADLAGAGDTRRRGFVAHAYGVAGRVPEARTILRELLEGRQVGYVPPIAIAAAYVGLGEHEHAIDWLEAGFNEHDGGMVLLATFSLWDPLRDHPRFKALLKKMKFPQLES